jgi:hypothetical protein
MSNSIVEMVNNGEIEFIDFMDGDVIVEIIEIGGGKYHLIGEGGDVVNRGYPVDDEYLERCINS